MSQVSKHKLKNQVYSKIFDLFPEFIARLSKSGKQNVALNTLLSQTERTMIAKRLAIALMLIKGYTYEQIIDKLKVSFGTISKISEAIKTSDSSFTNELEKIAKADQFSDFLNIIGYKLSIVMPPKGRNWSTWRRRIEEEKRKGNQPF